MRTHGNTKTRTNQFKHMTISIICRYVMKVKNLSGRNIAKSLGIHHRTWQRYVQGITRPEARIKQKIVKLMKVDDFNQLIGLAIDHYSNLK